MSSRHDLTLQQKVESNNELKSKLNTIMPTGHYYSQETKELIFNVIQFIEGEKNGPKIPLYNVNNLIMAALQISHGSMAKLKNEMKQLEEEQQMDLEHKLLEQ
ncbi:unnamed protein product [Rotaria sp. Silwood1]|nr:unnamed protein product [Rotaria sp. Silwood1]CAF4980369.1 unnamed protein product [Rotaria sp. Silwood1]